MRNRLRERGGFTVTETVIALGILVVVMMLLTEIACWALRERKRQALHQEALETAANVLEAARASPWESLTADWAKAQRLPDWLAERLTKGRLVVRVEPEMSRPQIKRITVEIDWVNDEGVPARPVHLMTLRSARAARATGETP